MKGSFDLACNAVDRPELVSPAETIPSFWRMDDVVLDAANNVMQGGFFDHQRQWWQLPNFIKALVGGYGSGKTLIGSKRCIALCLQNAPCPVAIVSPTYPLARETVIITIKQLLAGKKTILGRKLKWSYNNTQHEFKIRYKGREGRILVYPGDDPERLRGPNLAAAWLDEPFLMVQAVFEQMVARVRHPDASKREILLTGTPEQLNWGYDLCQGEMKDQQDVGVVFANTRQNLVVANEGYVERLEGVLTPKAALAYIGGQFINLAEGLVFYAYNAEYNEKKFPIPDGVELEAGMDFNVDPMTIAVFWRQGNHLHVIAEYELRNSDTEDACAFLRDKYGDRLTTIYPDATGMTRRSNSPAGKTDFDFIRQAGYSIVAPAKSPKRRDRINITNGKFKAKTGDVTLTHDPACKKLKRYLMQYSYEDMNTEEQKKMGHLIDAFSYPVSYLYNPRREAYSFKHEGS